MRRVACSITARTWAWVPLSRSTVNKSHARIAWAWSAGTATRQALWVPRTSSTSRDQAIFVDQATDASVSSDAVLLEIDWFG